MKKPSIWLLAGFFPGLLASVLVGASPARAQNLYVANGGNSTVTEYDATTGGSPIPTISSGVDAPSSVVLSGNTLYVANNSNNTVTVYDATAGGAPALTISSGVNSPQTLALSG